MSIAAVILAAGGSSRMGQPKQGMLFRGRPLVAHAVGSALEAGLSPVVVVAGADQGVVEKSVHGLAARVLVNPIWQRGIGTSIRAGVAAVASDPGVEAIVILLADQPLVDANLLRALVAVRYTKPGVACMYGGSMGVPALFGRALFPWLIALADEQGAKSILASLGDQLGVVDFPGGELDIDTPEDYRRIAGTESVSPAPVQVWNEGRFDSRTDALAVEEPLEISIRNRSVSVTMRTPGHDDELAAGFLLSEGLVRSREDILSIDPCAKNEHGNTINVRTGPLVHIDYDKLVRHVFVSSSCGLCGKASIEAVRMQIPRIESTATIAPEVLCKLPDAMRARQLAFSESGGLHAAAIFDCRGNLLVIREDVGRHNAVDKAIGRLFLDGIAPLEDHILLVSGRASFEIIQKAAAAGIAIIAAVSAPSSLAVSLAAELNQTLIGFLRPPRFNVYTHTHRVVAR